MKNIKLIVSISLLTFIFFKQVYGAESNIDNALRVFLDGYNIEKFLEAQDQELIDDGFYLVKSGDTLDQIVERIYPNSQIRKNILQQAFVLANPNSFRNGNPNFLYADQTLSLPTEEHISRIIFNENSRIERSNRTEWVRFP